MMMKTAEEHAEEIVKWVRRCQANGMNKVSPDGLNQMTVTIIGEVQREAADEMRKRCAETLKNQYGSGKLFAERIRVVPLPGDKK